MKFAASINVMPKKEILDPQGKVVTTNMKSLGLPEIQNVRIGKHFTLEIETANRDEAQEKVEMACKQLFANLIMEDFEFELSEL